MHPPPGLVNPSVCLAIEVARRALTPHLDMRLCHTYMPLLCQHPTCTEPLLTQYRHHPTPMLTTAPRPVQACPSPSTFVLELGAQSTSNSLCLGSRGGTAGCWSTTPMAARARRPTWSAPRRRWQGWPPCASDALKRSSFAYLRLGAVRIWSTCSCHPLSRAGCSTVSLCGSRA